MSAQQILPLRPARVSDCEVVYLPTREGETTVISRDCSDRSACANCHHREDRRSGPGLCVVVVPRYVPIELCATYRVSPGGVDPG